MGAYFHIKGSKWSWLRGGGSNYRRVGGGALMRTGGGVIILLTVCTVSGATTTPSREGKTGYSIQGAINKETVIQSSVKYEVVSSL